MVTLTLSFFALAFFSSAAIRGLSPVFGDKGFNYQNIFQIELNPKRQPLLRTNIECLSPDEGKY